MTTEPKDVRGGDEVKRSAQSPSDPYAGMGPCPKRGEIRVIGGQTLRFIERELEGDKWEVIGPASPSDPPPVREVVAWRWRYGDDWYAGTVRPSFSGGERVADEVRALVDADPLPVSREADIQEALDLALLILGRMEPGDSRAVSNEYVAMLAAGTSHHNDEGRKIIRDAIRALTGKSSR